MAITSQTLTLDGPGTVGSNGLINMSGGTLTGTGDLTINSSLNWTGGIMSGTGTTFANGGLSLSGLSRTLSARRFVNAGTAIWTSGNFVFSANGSFSNAASGTVDITFDGPVLNGAGGGSIANAGLFRQAAGTNGTINPLLLDFSWGTLGGSNDVVVSGPIVWSGGTMEDSGTTFANGGLILTGSPNKTLDGRRLVNTGRANWTGGGDFIFSGGGLLTTNRFYRGRL